MMTTTDGEANGAPNLIFSAVFEEDKKPDPPHFAFG